MELKKHKFCDSIIYRNVNVLRMMTSCKKITMIYRSGSQIGVCLSTQLNVNSCVSKDETSKPAYLPAERSSPGRGGWCYLSWKLLYPITTHGRSTSQRVVKGNKTLGFVILKNQGTRWHSHGTTNYSILICYIYGAFIKKKLSLNIDMVQRRSARYVTRRPDRLDRVTDMLHELSWEALDQTRTNGSDASERVI